MLRLFINFKWNDNRATGYKQLNDNARLLLNTLRFDSFFFNNYISFGFNLKWRKRDCEWSNEKNNLMFKNTILFSLHIDSGFKNSQILQFTRRKKE